MSRLEHLTDEFGNDIYFGTGYSGPDGVRFPPGTHISDFTQQLQDVKNMQLRSDDVLIVGYPKTGNNWTHHMVSMLMEGVTELPPILQPQDFIFLDTWWYGNMFDYVLHWEKEIASHPDLPVFHVSYEETVQDPLGQVEKLNQFLGTDRDKEFCQKVVDACSFTNIPRSRQLDEGHMKNNCSWKEGNSLNHCYRKGKVGDWKNWFTVAQNEQFDKICTDKMAGSKMTFAYE